MPVLPASSKEVSAEVGAGMARPRARDKETSGWRRFDQEYRYPSEQGTLRGPESPATGSSGWSTQPGVLAPVPLMGYGCCCFCDQSLH